MSILIKGMEMPKNCMDCPFKGFDRVKGRGNICTINDSITLHAVLDGVDVKFVRMGDCPLVPVPPHGRLIDADALRQSMYHEAFETDSNMQKWESGCWIRYKMFENAIESEPTIDAVPVKHGEWIVKGQDIFCSVCGEESAYTWCGASKFSNYCPNCGADMRERKDDDNNEI